VRRFRINGERYDLDALLLNVQTLGVNAQVEITKKWSH
jgi:hypothetical protein